MLRTWDNSAKQGIFKVCHIPTPDREADDRVRAIKKSHEKSLLSKFKSLNSRKVQEHCYQEQHNYYKLSYQPHYNVLLYGYNSTHTLIGR